MKYYKRPFSWTWQSYTGNEYEDDSRYFKVINGISFEWDRQKRNWYKYGTISDLQLSGMNLEEISEQEVFIDLL